MTFERSTDYPLIRAIITHPTQYAAASDDFSPTASDFQVNEDPRIWYVLAWDQYGVLGLFTFIPENAIAFQAHVCLLPCAWGEPGRELARRIVPWMWQHSPAKRITGSIRGDNKLALRYAALCGMRTIGINERSVMKDGRLQDQVLLGVSPWPQQSPA